MIERGQAVVVVESMKMEMEIVAPEAGRVAEIRCKQGRGVRAGDAVAVLEKVGQ
jgi:urea carboxylase